MLAGRGLRESALARDGACARGAQARVADAGLGLVSLTEDGRPCLLQLPEGAALESDSVDLDDVVCVPTMSDDGAGRGRGRGRRAAAPGQCGAGRRGRARQHHWPPQICLHASAGLILGKQSPSARCIRVG